MEDHPLVESIAHSLELLSTFEDAVKNCETDGAEPMKTAINALLASFSETERIARDHPDGQLEIPDEILLGLTDWDQVPINELEKTIKDHDKLRQQKRHMADLSQLITAAMNNTPPPPPP